MTAHAGVPSGYVSERLGGVTLVARVESLAAARSMIEDAGSLHAYAASRGAALPGRGRGVALHVAADSADWVVRHYLRGGRVAPLLHDRYLRFGRWRPIRELHASVAARRRGVRTPAVEAACIAISGCFYRGDIATRLVPAAMDLATLVLRGEADDPPSWRAAGRLLRDALEAGVVHPDLNLGNVLIQRTGEELAAHLVDLDRVRLVERLSRWQRVRMLNRFHHSRLRLERLGGQPVPARALAAFEEALRG
jgi:hypothetical protein